MLARGHWFIPLILLLSTHLHASVGAISISPKKIPSIRVRLADALESLSITGTDLRRYLHPDQNLKKFSGYKRIRFNCTNLFVQKEKQKRRPVLLASLSSATGLIRFGEDKYKGNLLVLTNQNQESCDVVHETQLEDYLPSLLAKEMSSSWPIEALKAQAVAARTYALHKIYSKQVSREQGFESYYDLENSERHQVSGTFFDTTRATQFATKDTEGEVLMLKNGLITPTFFHAESGGKTLLPSDVWDGSVAGYQRVPQPYAKSQMKWSTILSKERFDHFLRWYVKRTTVGLFQKLSFGTIMLAPDRLDNLKLRLYVGDDVYLIEKVFLRRFFGRNDFASNSFVLSKKGDSFFVDGVGGGHGVGMSQIGARYLAEQGWDYKKILAYYYPGHNLKKIY